MEKLQLKILKMLLVVMSPQGIITKVSSLPNLYGHFSIFLIVLVFKPAALMCCITFTAFINLIPDGGQMENIVEHLTAEEPDMSVMSW